MKILVLNYEYVPIGGGGSIVSKELCEHFSSLGNSVDVVTMGYKTLKKYENVKGVNIHRVKCLRTKINICYPWEQLTYCISAYRYIKKNLNIKNYDIVHCHFIIPTGLLALILKMKYKKEYILTSHGSDVIGHNKSRFKVLYKIVTPLWKIIVKNAIAVTAPSKYLLEKIKRIYPQANVVLIQNGINVSDFKKCKKERIITTLSTIKESKGIQDIIEAISELDLKEWKLQIIGEGPYLNTLKEQVKKYNLDSKVVFYGRIDGQKRFDYLSSSGMYFTGSRFEAFPVSLLEAMGANCKIVASNIDVYQEFKEYIYIYKNKNELKKIVKDIISVKPEAKRYDISKYDWNNIYLLYIDLFKRTIEEINAN